MKLFKNRTVLGIFCIAVSLIICFAITPLVNAGLSKKVTIVRFNKQVNEGEEITRGMLEEVEVGNHNLPENVIRNIADVEGKYLTATVYAGDYILTDKISDEPAAENKYLYSLNGEKQAMSITINTFAEGLSGKLKSGDIVSVIAPDYLGSGETVIPAELKYVEVIAVTAKSGYDANTEDRTADEDENRRGYHKAFWKAGCHLGKSGLLHIQYCCNQSSQKKKFGYRKSGAGQCLCKIL